MLNEYQQNCESLVGDFGDQIWNRALHWEEFLVNVPHNLTSVTTTSRDIENDQMPIYTQGLITAYRQTDTTFLLKKVWVYEIAEFCD